MSQVLGCVTLETMLIQMVIILNLKSKGKIGMHMNILIKFKSLASLMILKAIFCASFIVPAYAGNKKLQWGNDHQATFFMEAGGRFYLYFFTGAAHRPDFLKLLLIVFIYLPSIATAQSEVPLYKLIKGEGQPLCEAYTDMLNAHPDWPIPVCDARADPSFDFTLPEWKSVEISKNKDFVEKIAHCSYDGSFCRKEPVDDAKWGVWIDKQINENSFSLYQADLDGKNPYIKSDWPEPYTSYLYKPNGCSVTEEFKWARPRHVMHISEKSGSMTLVDEVRNVLYFEGKPIYQRWECSGEYIDGKYDQFCYAVLIDVPEFCQVRYQGPVPKGVFK